MSNCGDSRTGTMRLVETKEIASGRKRQEEEGEGGASDVESTERPSDRRLPR